MKVFLVTGAGDTVRVRFLSVDLGVAAFSIAPILLRVRACEKKSVHRYTFQ